MGDKKKTNIFCRLVRVLVFKLTQCCNRRHVTLQILRVFLHQIWSVVKVANLTIDLFHLSSVHLLDEINQPWHASSDCVLCFVPVG